MVDWPAFRTPPQSCPACKRTLDTATAVRHDCSPKEGNLSVCIGCGSYLVFDGSLRLQLLDAESFRGLPVESQIEMRRVRDAARAVRARKG